MLAMNGHSAEAAPMPPSAAAVRVRKSRRDVSAPPWFPAAPPPVGGATSATSTRDCGALLRLVCSITHSHINARTRRSTRLREQPLILEVVVEMGDELAVAVPDQRRAPLVGTEHALGRLAPTRGWHVRVDVGPESILARLQ